MTSLELASKIDHTLLKPEATREEIQRILTEAQAHRFASVCLSPRWVTLARKSLEGTGVLTCTVAGFPHGTSKSTIKAIEAVSSAKDGADEIDVVAHLPALLAADLDAIKSDLLEFVRAARAANPELVVKVIVESALLMQLPPPRAEECIAAACRAVRESGCDFIKTSTGYHPAGGATVEAVRLMKKYSEGIKIKAAGGIRDLKTAMAMLEAGADRLGMSASVAVLNERAKTKEN